MKAFCVQCGVGVGFDDDGCCTSCGCQVCGMDDVERHLNAAGYTLVKDCPEHGWLCMDARCESREKAST